jgi:tRNA nucleotidyltransferase (CCA-adding enzyme)
LEQKEALDINQESIKPLVMGRDLVNLGISPGKAMGDYLQKLYELQLDGAFQTTAEGLEMFKKLQSGQA